MLGSYPEDGQALELEDGQELEEDSILELVEVSTQEPVEDSIQELVEDNIPELVEDSTQEQVEAGCSVLRPSWGCTCSRGAATCAAPSAGPALCSSDLSPRHSAASIAQTVPWS